MFEPISKSTRKAYLFITKKTLVVYRIPSFVTAFINETLVIKRFPKVFHCLFVSLFGCANEIGVFHVALIEQIAKFARYVIAKLETIDFFRLCSLLDFEPVLVGACAEYHLVLVLI